MLPIAYLPSFSFFITRITVSAFTKKPKDHIGEIKLLLFSYLLQVSLGKDEKGFAGTQTANCLTAKSQDSGVISYGS